MEYISYEIYQKLVQANPTLFWIIVGILCLVFVEVIFLYMVKSSKNKKKTEFTFVAYKILASLVFVYATLLLWCILIGIEIIIFYLVKYPIIFPILIIVIIFIGVNIIIGKAIDKPKRKRK